MKDAYYFPHDSNAKDDPKCSMLIEQLGCEGYGIYWILVETLRDQPHYRYPISMLPIIARKYNTTHEKVKVVVGNYGLFVVDEEQFFSLSLNRRMEQIEKMRDINRLKGIKSGEARRLLALQEGKKDKNEPELNSGSTGGEQKKEKEKKEKEINNLESAINDFKLMRDRIKKPLTARAKTRLIHSLNKLASTDEEKIAILEQSIFHCWQDVYELKNKPPQPDRRNII